MWSKYFILLVILFYLVYLGLNINFFIDEIFVFSINDIFGELCIVFLLVGLCYDII